MAKRKSMSQSDVSNVWKRVWSVERVTSARATFSNRLFIEGFRVMRPLIRGDVRTILETGTGSGRYAVAFAKDFPNAIVTATDLVPQSLDATMRLARDAGISNVTVEVADVERLHYETGVFDVVFSDALVQHVSDDTKAMAEMSRVLKSDGVLIVAVVNRWSLHFFVRFIESILHRSNEYGSERFYTHAQLRKMVETVGLEVLTQTGFYPAYGIYRLGRFWRPFAVLGRILNRMTRLLDTVTGDSISRWLGFEIVIVARKPKATSDSL